MKHPRLESMYAILRQGSWDELAADSHTRLYNGISKHNDCFCRDDLASSWIFIERVEKFAPFFIERLLQQINIHDAKGLYGHSVMGGLMSPFRSIVEGMKRVVEHESWPANELSLGRFFMLMDIYEGLAESQY